MILRFLQRYALIFSGIAGLLFTWAAVGEDANWWLRLAVGAPVMLFTYALLYNRLFTR